jgi:hypothetical protein
MLSSFTGWMNFGEVGDKFTVIVISATAVMGTLKIFVLYFPRKCFPFQLKCRSVKNKTPNSIM